MITHPLRFKKFSLTGLLNVLYYLGVIVICINLVRLFMYSGSTMQRIVHQSMIHELLIQILAFALGVIICWAVRHWLIRRRTRSIEQEVRSELEDIKKDVAALKKET